MRRRDSFDDGDSRSLSAVSPTIVGHVRRVRRREPSVGRARRRPRRFASTRDVFSAIELIAERFRPARSARQAALLCAVDIYAPASPAGAALRLEVLLERRSGSSTAWCFFDLLAVYLSNVHQHVFECASTLGVGRPRAVDDFTVPLGR